MMRDEVFENLNSGYPGLPLVRDLGLPTETHDVRVFDHGGNHVGQAVWEDFGISVNHENDLIEVRRYASDFPQAVEHLELQFCHTLVEHNLLQERHQDDLTVTLASVSGFALLGFIRCTTFDNNHHGY